MDLSTHLSKAEPTPTKKAFFNFLQLPTEIRLKVYEEVFVPKDFKARLPRKKYESTLIANGVIASLVYPAGSEVTMVNKQVRDESLCVLYKTHLFILNVWEDYDDVDPDRRYFSTTEQLLTQLLRPSAPRYLSMMTHLDLYVDRFEDFGKECRDDIVRQISSSCTKLKTFRLELERIPQDWTFPKETFNLEQQTHDKFEGNIFESLRALANRVREFEIVCEYGENESQHHDLMECLFPGQQYIRIEEEYQIKWRSQIAEKLRSLAFYIH
ncbi:MAG: hypothetical protein OHK93_005322 [Ramalina farinacea]|uniref:Uncharacterized protein n=1 Tax=Ramalina farinacea TaxID=258253 RepID=A0AA43U2E8_9LECA|nr:hypothetical protein [Ramalina farinacea]